MKMKIAIYKQLHIFVSDWGDVSCDTDTVGEMWIHNEAKTGQSGTSKYDKNNRNN